MHPFPPPEAVWPDGQTRLHVYALPDRIANAEVLALIARAVPVCRAFADSNALVAEQWLHATVRQITCDARTIDQHERTRLVSALQERLAGLTPFTLMAGGVFAGSGGVVLALGGDRPGEPWHEMAARVHDAIESILGHEALSHHPGPPHISLTYCTRAIDPYDLQQRLWSEVEPMRAPFVVREVHLVDVIQDADAHTYTWRSLARIPMGTTRAGAPPGIRGRR